MPTLTPINATGTAASPIDGLGTIFEYSMDAGTTWHQVANLTDIKAHEVTHGKVKSSTHSTTVMNTYRPQTLGEPGETEFSLLYDKTAYGVLSGLQVAKTGLLCRTTYKDAATDAISGYIAGLKIVTPSEGDATMGLKIQHSGAATVTTT